MFGLSSESNNLCRKFPGMFWQWGRARRCPRSSLSGGSLSRQAPFSPCVPLFILRPPVPRQPKFLSATVAPIYLRSINPHRPCFFRHLAHLHYYPRSMHSLSYIELVVILTTSSILSAFMCVAVEMQDTHLKNKPLTIAA